MGGNTTPHIEYCLTWKNYYSLKNIHSYMEILCGQTLLHRGIITISLENFCSYIHYTNQSAETTKLFHLR